MRGHFTVNHCIIRVYAILAEMERFTTRRPCLHCCNTDVTSDYVLMIIRYVLAAVILLACSFAASAQVDAPVNAGGQFGYEGYHPFVEGRPWGVVIEGYFNRNRIIRDPASYFLRVGLNYDLGGGNRISGGYATQYTEPSDAASDPYKFPEHRIWEQFTWKRKFGEAKRHNFIQRFRVEQRWIGRKTAPAFDRITSWYFENALRYQAKFITPITKKISLNLNDEIAVRIPPPTGRKFVDLNQLYAGLIFPLDKKRLWRLEMGYSLQTVWRPATTASGLRRVNHIFSIVIKSDAPFKPKR